MSEALRLSSLALFAVGPVVAVMALLRRGLEPSPMRSRIRSWRWYVPAVLLPAEWLLPPILIALRVGEIEVGWLPVRVVGLAVGLAGAVLLTWSAVLLGRFMMHEAAVREDHALIRNGPYRFIRHPVYAGYLALLLGMHKKGVWNPTSSARPVQRAQAQGSRHLFCAKRCCLAEYLALAPLARRAHGDTHPGGLGGATPRGKVRPGPCLLRSADWSAGSPPLGAGRRPTRYTEPRRLEILRFQLSGGPGEEQQDDPSGIGWSR